MVDQELMCCYSGWFGNINFKPAKCTQKKRQKGRKKRR